MYARVSVELLPDDAPVVILVLFPVAFIEQAGDRFPVRWLSNDSK
jgi:hypothetical protein